MTNNKILYIVIVVLILIVLGGGLILFSGNKGEQNGKQSAADDQEMVDCSGAEDPFCFISRMNECLPVTAKGMGTDGTTTFEITILGIENETCHFQRKINDVLNLNCFFPKGTLNMDTLDQTFGNDKGLQSVVDDACRPVGW